ncbi:hypothetical protein ASZ90_007272 [hydrocarbon metagenome]|uniref:Uncharacterized protein n=1 Tax=hydrocarbon metagenome TaxID=938273 RepID=A0A0W8FQ81_9ZZZZ
MQKLIFREPICTKDSCEQHDPQYLNNCRSLFLVESCCDAEVKYPPRRLLRVIAWLDKHLPCIALIIGALAILFFAIFMSWLVAPSR